MTRERLQSLSMAALQDIARKKNIPHHRDISSEQLIEVILDAIEDDRDEREMMNNPAMRVSEKKYDIIHDDDYAGEEEGSEFPIPESYNETKIMLLLRDPQWAFAYWDIKDTDIAAINENPSTLRLYIRVHEISGESLSAETRVTSHDIPVKFSDKSWYINLPKAGVNYCLELACRDGRTHTVLCRSNTVHSPRGTLPGDYLEDLKKSADEILMLSGLPDVDRSALSEGIPQRVISLLDTQYLHLSG